MSGAYNEKNLIKVRQVCFIYAALIPVNKFVFMPSVLAESGGEDFLISLAVNFLIDGLILAAVLFAAEKKRNLTLYRTLERGYNPPTAKVAYMILAAFFLIKSVVPVFELKSYIESTLYEMMPHGAIFFIFFIVSTYLSLKGLKIIGRCADVAVWFSLAGVAVCLFLSVGSADYSNLLPIFKKPVYNTVITSLSTLLWHGDAMYIFLMIGHFRKEKLYKTKIAASYCIGAVVTVFFIMTFYAVYGSIAPSQIYAFSAISVFSVIVTNIGRFDFVSIFFVMFSQVIAVSLPLVMASKCLERVFGANNSAPFAFIVNGAALVITAIFSSKVFAVIDVYLKYFVYALIGAFIAVFGLLLFAKKECKNETC